MSNDPRLEKFHNYKFASYCADQAEIIGLRAELKAQREMAAIFEQGQQNACEQLDMLREAHRFDGETALNNINEIMRLGAEAVPSDTVRQSVGGGCAGGLRQGRGGRDVRMGQRTKRQVQSGVPGYRGRDQEKCPDVKTPR